MTTRKPQAKTVCTGGFYPPNKWRLTSPKFLTNLATELSESGLPASQIVFQAIDALLSNEAVLHDLDGNQIDMMGEYENGLDVIEWAFGGDWARGIRRLLERAERPFPNQMKATPKLMMRILLLYYSLQVRKCEAMQCHAGNVPDLS